MKSLIIVNPVDCIGCRTCEVACVVAHPSEQELTADVFLPRLKVQRLDRISAPVMCHQCENAPCVGACPVQALTMGKQVVQANSARCIGCQSCVSACPFGMITIHILPGNVRSEIVKCDLCEQREEGPACVASCPTQALQLLTEGELRRVRQLRIAASGKSPL
ncbi:MULTISPECIES: 4Fe-4S dicluster domain-containing protein [unclassified Escherichia]|uniref:4Fe-4S dicluster domain-containing protein n=1 Tax=unclassified Escherichia TaxID=2608889 RepID=UPI001029BDC2|nr:MULTISPECIES: 4Fe-4S dicluster domain-containing protein [unclassified Escherichia]RZM87772.1 4Fe-4S dicluster domain-containing protein [Escherichia sp. E1V33]TBR68027.1 4Fe-4S dicluster domain-containing protein [Escherichia sp. E1S7]